MAYYFLTASKDATVYLQQPNQNTGLDEILEISKIYYGNIKDVSRAFLKFEVGNLSASLANGAVSMSEASLILKETKTEEVPLQYTIYAFPISGSWEMGTGTRFDNISTKGVTWNYREGDSKLDWLENNLNLGTDANPNNGQGGTWWSGISSTQNFNYSTADITLDMKTMLRNWISGSIPNDGVVIKFDSNLENDTQDYGIIKLFSKETNTIYQPKIRIGWDNQSFSTGSLIAITNSLSKIGISNFKKEYKVNTKVKLNLFARDLYPLKTFTNQFSYTTTKYLPKLSYYQIRDYESQEVIVPFSDYSKINCNSESNFIILDLTNWEHDRVYKIEFKVDFGNGDIQYFDDDLTFKIVKY